MAACDTEASSFPLLSGCPSNGEYFLVGNAIGGSGVGLYARRPYSSVISCILGSLKFGFLQFKIGQSGSPMNSGDTVLTINQINIVQFSAFVVLDGSVLPQSDNTQISYTIAYNTNDIVIAFNQGVSNNQTYSVYYAYIGSGSVPVVPSGYNSGNSIQNGTGTQLQFIIPHGLGTIPSFISADAGSSDAVGIASRTADATNIYVNYGSAPPIGAGNVIIYWSARA